MNLFKKLWEGYSRFITLEWLLERGISHERLMSGVLLVGSLWFIVCAYRALVLHVPYLSKYGVPVTGNALTTGGIISLLFGIGMGMVSLVFFCLGKRKANYGLSKDTSQKP